MIIFLSSISEAISIRYFELNPIAISSPSYFAATTSLPSPELVLLTDNLNLSLLSSNFTPSFLSKDTDATLSTEFIKSLDVPTSMNLFRMTPLRGYSMIVFETRLVFSLIEMFFGGGVVGIGWRFGYLVCLDIAYVCVRRAISTRKRT